MPGLDVEEVYESDSSDNEGNHSTLLSSISQLDSTQRIKPAQRKEIASEVSEFNLNKGVLSKKNLVDIRELVKVLGKKPEHGAITHKIKEVSQKSKVLPKPLEKPTEERIKREIGFGKVKKTLRKWDAIVTRNALKDRIHFPLNDTSMKLEKSNEFLSQFKNPTPLEIEMAKVLNQEIKEDKDSDKEEFPLTLEEMMEKRKEMAQLRARLSYSQTKAQRQSKIKSKKYHRLLKREKIRQQLKEFELLQKTDPEAALKKLAELDKTRAKERASLRHRNTGKWAKNLAVRAKYDVETRKVLSEQLKMSRELTQKVSQLDSSGDEETEEPVPFEKVNTESNATAKSSTDNPWMLEVSKEVQDFVTDCKKFWSEKGDEINSNELKERKESNEKTATKDKKESSEKTTSKDKKESNQKNETLNGYQTPTEETTGGYEDTKKVQKVKGSKKTEMLKSPDKNKSPKKKKAKPKEKETNSKNKKAFVSIQPSSGIWLVTPVAKKTNSKVKSKKRKAEDIDTLFDDLNEKLMNKANRKVAKMKKNLRRKEMREKKLEQNKSEKEFDLTLKNTNVVERPDLDVGLLEGGVEDDVVEPVSEPVANPVVDDSKNEPAPSIDPKNFIQVKPKRLNSHLPDNITGEEGGIDDDDKVQQMIIAEAFEDDDVMAEFDKLKKEEEEKSKVEIETTLPGWGHWGGTGIVPNNRKKRLLVLNLPPRKDKLKKDIIINENENPNLKNHLVKEVPHPFKSVEAFEANIRAPVGRDWVPETAHHKLIQRPVVTKLGTVIEPMSEDQIVRLKKETKSPYRGKKKKTK